mgnify:CR=1
MTNSKNQNPSNEKTTSPSFEEAFERLETILDQMNRGTVSLEESLKLYEEADHLITTCSQRLNEAERRIEILSKNRKGELILNSENQPTTEEFNVPL